jgi:hypothetical protein
VLKRRLPVLWAAAIMLLTVLACSGIVLAITNGWVDDGLKDAPIGDIEEPDPHTIKYPNVGALVDRSGTYCSGTLVAGKNGAPSL